MIYRHIRARVESGFSPLGLLEDAQGETGLESPQPRLVMLACGALAQ